MSKQRQFEVVLVSKAEIRSTYRVLAATAEEAVAKARSGDRPPDEDETLEQRDYECEVNGEDRSDLLPRFSG